MNKTKYSHAENDKILDIWEEFSIKNGDGEIERDGVAYKGCIHTFTGADEKVYHEREVGNEESAWNNSDKRILFVAKELNDPDNPYDSRVVITYDPKNGIAPTDPFLKSMLYITKGLMESTADKVAEFNRDESMDNIMSTWDKSAVAKINVKKQPGGSVSDMAEIDSYMQTYHWRLLKSVNAKLLNSVFMLVTRFSGLQTLSHFSNDYIGVGALKLGSPIFHECRTIHFQPDC